jgi:hypothetical protein
MNRDIADSMDELRRRVAEQRAAGVYDVDDVRGVLGSPEAPALVRDLAHAARLADISPAPAPPAPDGHGPRAIAGRARSSARNVARRPVADVADRTTAFNTAVVAYLLQLAEEVEVLRAEVERLSGRPQGSD